MATIFLCYRRTDSPQACRVYDWLTRRFGHDAVFMDTRSIPVAVSFPQHIRDAIAASKIMIVLIGEAWATSIGDPDDFVRAELEAAIADDVTLIPVLIGNTPMPDASELPPSIATLAMRNAANVGVHHDFDTHMQSLLVLIETILGEPAFRSRAVSSDQAIRGACEGLMAFLAKRVWSAEYDVVYQVIGAQDFNDPTRDFVGRSVTLFLHRVRPVAEMLELHVILTFWAHASSYEQILAGKVLRELERTPVIPAEFLQEHAPDAVPPGCVLKIRPSDEDARRIWQMITSQPLRLSLAYVATIAPRPDGGPIAP